MHNSNNSAVRKDYFTGTLIAQSKLLGFQTDLNQVNPSEMMLLAAELRGI